MSEISEIELKSQQILKHAIETEASDIHFLPRKHDVLIELRIHGYLYELDMIPIEQAERMISHFKFLAGMDIGEKRRPQSGAMISNVSHKEVNLRLSTLPTPYQESLVIRLQPQKQSIRISDLSIFQESTNQLSSLLKYESGLILVSGPTGSGKTTTLYTLLQAAKKRYNARIITLEDPIERPNDAFVQMQINEKANFSYADGFRALLRHDPDILMIGEIRDIETAKIAVRAALTGHLVLSTVHAFDAPGTVQRLTELGIPIFDLKETLVGVISQRLVRIQCPTCGSSCTKQCPHRHQPKQTGIFEILVGISLHDTLIHGSRQHSRSYKTIEDFILQGIAAGYIPQEMPKGQIRRYVQP